MMEHRKYRARLEEWMSLSRRTRRDQVRQMILIAEANQHGSLKHLMDDAGISKARARALLDAYNEYVSLDILPADIKDANDIRTSELVYQMWDEVYDGIKHDKRFAAIEDREEISEQAEELGLKGPSKALDIAKNLPSLLAAIMGSHDTAMAAVRGVFGRSEHDNEVRQTLQDGMLDMWHRERKGGGSRPKLSDEEYTWKLTDRWMATCRKLHDFDVPERLTGLTLERLYEGKKVIDETILIMEARGALEDTPI